MIRLLISLVVAAFLLASAVTAQDVAVRADHPGEYVVVKGDTLWDISGRFLDKPWQWPSIWHANPQIENPHLIYPGDRISLVYVDGVPQLRLSRGGKRTIKLSPTVREVQRAEAISSVPFESIEPFIRDMHIVSEAEFESLPYIVANEEDRMNSTYSDRTYARNLGGQVGEEFIVARLTNIYDRVDDEPGGLRRVMPKDHWKQVPNVWDRNQHTWNQTKPWNRRPQDPAGYELKEVSRVRVTQAGEIAVLEIIRDRTEVSPGDVILPVRDRGYPSTFYPQAMDRVPDGLRVMATSGQRSGVGHYQIVSINGGSQQGIEPGHVFSAFRLGQEVRDRSGHRYGSFSDDAKVQLPEVYDGLVMVFKTFDEVSYAMVMSGSRVVQEYDVLRHPDKRM